MPFQHRNIVRVKNFIFSLATLPVDSLDSIEPFNGFSPSITDSSKNKNKPLVQPAIIVFDSATDITSKRIQVVKYLPITTN